MVKTTSDYISSRISSTRADQVGGTELDSHADSPVVGSCCYVLGNTGRSVNVSGFTDKLGTPLNVDVVDVAVTYNDPFEGDTYLLIIKNALHVPLMTNNLVPPFMMRLAGIQVDECPKFLSEQATEKNHSILFRKENVRMPLQLSNTISLIST